MSNLPRENIFNTNTHIEHSCFHTYVIARLVSFLSACIYNPLIVARRIYEDT